jgi:hypothetical protein
VRRALVSIVVFAAVGTAGWYGLHWVPADYSYGLEAEFADAPPDDEALAAWVRLQPGVHLAHARREQVGDRWRVVVILGVTRNGWGQPPLPDLDDATAELGYRGQAGRFRDSPQ